MDPIKIQEQINKNRRSVGFDSYDISVRQLYDMVVEGMIDIAPEYQRHFVWNDIRQSQLIESLLLGIPVPNIFMATNKDSTWEVIDGLQRMTTIINFIGEHEIIKKVNPSCHKLTLKGLYKLDSINELKFESMPKSLQLMFLTRPIRVTVLNDKSDFDLRYDLFERLNTGGITLHPQEIRNCVFLGYFNDFIKECAAYPLFKQVVKIPKTEGQSNLEELVLKFFAYYESRQEFIHSVNGFLNQYMEKKTKSFKEDEKKRFKEIFSRTFSILAENLPHGIVRSNRKNITPLILFEAISLGVAQAIEQGFSINATSLIELLDDDHLKKLTTGATNSRSRLSQRINYVTDTLKR
jgi:uncharacterized protein with ParB-like and HNH nuclease domain